MEDKKLFRTIQCVYALLIVFIPLMWIGCLVLCILKGALYAFTMCLVPLIVLAFMLIFAHLCNTKNLY